MRPPRGLAIRAIHNRATGARGVADQWVAIDNDGPLRWHLHEWEFVDQAPDGDVARVYRFPVRLTNSAVWSFEPGESLYVFAGSGTDRFVERSGERPQFHFFRGPGEAWDTDGGHVYLRSRDGRFATRPVPIPSAGDDGDGLD